MQYRSRMPVSNTCYYVNELYTDEDSNNGHKCSSQITVIPAVWYVNGGPSNVMFICTCFVGLICKLFSIVRGVCWINWRIQRMMQGSGENRLICCLVVGRSTDIRWPHAGADADTAPSLLFPGQWLRDSPLHSPDSRYAGFRYGPHTPAEAQ